MNLVICHFYQRRRSRSSSQGKSKSKSKSSVGRKAQTAAPTPLRLRKRYCHSFPPSEILSNVREVAQLCVCCDRKPVNIGTQLGPVPTPIGEVQVQAEGCLRRMHTFFSASQRMAQKIQRLPSCFSYIKSRRWSVGCVILCFFFCLN